MNNETIKVGDIITAYHAGFHRVIEIITENTDEWDLPDYSFPMIRYESLLSANFKPRHGFKYCCSANHCQKLDKQLIEKIRQNEIKKVNSACDELLKCLDSVV